MKKLILTLALFLLPALALAQTFEPDGAIRSMSQTHVWNAGTSAWDKWEGVVQQGGAPWSFTSTQLPAALGANGGLKVEGIAGGVAQPISAATLPLPTGAATSANQDGIIRDGTGDTTQANVVAGRVIVDGSQVTQPISGTVTATTDGIVRDGGGAGQADVIGVAPTTEQGLVVRNIPSGTQPVSGTVGISGSVAVTGPLTDAQLRATAVPVTIPVPAPISDNGGSVTVDSTQLPAALAAGGGLKVEGVAGGVAQPVSATSLPLPTGAATSALQTQPGVDIGDVTVNNAAGAASVNVQDGGNSLTVDGTVSVSGSVAVTGPLTDAQLRASAVPISAAALPLPTGAATSALQDGIIRDGTGDTTQANVILGRQIVDGSQVTQPVSAASLPLPTGAATEATLATRAASTQLPAALVGSRLDVNLGAIGGTAQSGAQIVDVGNTAWRVNCVTGCVAGGSFLDGAAFTFGTTAVSNTAFVVDDVASTTVAENSAGAGRMSTNRIPYFALRTAAGAALLGQGAMAASIPVVIASDQSAIPISAASLPLPAGAATAALQDGKIKDGTGAGQADVGAVAPPLTNEGLNVRSIDSTRTVTGSLDCLTLNGAVTISGEGAGSITAALPAVGFAGACTVSFEATGDGTNWFATEVVPSSLSAGPTDVDFTRSYTSFLGTNVQLWKFVQPGFRSYRVRLSATGGAGSGTVTLDANGSETTGTPHAFYWTTSTVFNLTTIGNIFAVSTQGAAMLVVHFSATLGASTITPTISGSTGAMNCYELGSASRLALTSWTGAVNGISWACPLYGATGVNLTKDFGVGVGTTTITLFLSSVNNVTIDGRPVSQWVSGSSPTTVSFGVPKQLVTPEGIAAVTTDHPRWFQCAMTSTATAATVITTCTGAVATMAAPGAGLRLYITGFEYSSSIISTTANFMTLRYGTGGTCGTGTQTLWVGANSVAFDEVSPSLGGNGMKAAQNNEVCFIHPGAGTRWINVRGYVAP